MKNDPQVMFRYIRENKSAKKEEGKQVKVIRLNKNGKKSKLAGDTVRFSNTDEAQEYIKNHYVLNPKSSAKFIVE